jgi:hypothetical protein
MTCRYMVRRGSFRCTVLPRLEYFDRLSDRWIIEVEEPEWEEAPAPPLNDAWEEVPEPPNQKVLEEVPAPPAQRMGVCAPTQPAHDAWEYAPAALEYHPREGSS